MSFLDWRAAMDRRLGIGSEPADKLKPEVTWLAVATAMVIGAAGDFVVRGWRTFALVEFGLAVAAAGVSAVLWMRSRRHPGQSGEVVPLDSSREGPHHINQAKDRAR